MTRHSWWWLARGRRSRDRRRPWLRREQEPVCKVVKFQPLLAGIITVYETIEPLFWFWRKKTTAPWKSWKWQSDLGFPEESSGQADQLPLTHAQVFSSLGHLHLSHLGHLWHLRICVIFHIRDTKKITVLTVAIWIMRFVFNLNCVVLYQLSSSFYWQSWNWFS